MTNLKTNSFEAIIFDCDGTLVDSEPITNDVLVEYVAEFGLQLDPLKSASLFVGRDMPGIVKVLEADLGGPLPDQFTEEFRARQALALEQRLQAIDGARELLQSVKLPMYLASNAPRDKIDINLRVTGLRDFFPDDRVFSAYDINVWKPAPDLFLHVADRAGTDPQRCAVIEDSAAGLEAAARADMHVFCYAPVQDVALTADIATLPRLQEMRIMRKLIDLTTHFAAQTQT